MGAAPTGNAVDVELMVFARFSPETKIVERWTGLDEVSLLMQLGLMAAPTGAPGLAAEYVAVRPFLAVTHGYR
jgi:hypothetical protein